jgi:hypothetical protein
MLTSNSLSEHSKPYALHIIEIADPDDQKPGK